MGKTNHKWPFSIAMLVYQRVVQALFASSAACDLQDDKHILCSGVVRASGYLHFAAEFGALLAVGKKQMHMLSKNCTSSYFTMIPLFFPSIRWLYPQWRSVGKRYNLVLRASRLTLAVGHRKWVTSTWILQGNGRSTDGFDGNIYIYTYIIYIYTLFSEKPKSIWGSLEVLTVAWFPEFAISETDSGSLHIGDGSSQESMDSSGETLRFREADTEDSCLQQFSLVASSVEGPGPLGNWRM